MLTFPLTSPYTIPPITVTLPLKAFIERPKPRKRPRRHTKRVNKHTKRQTKKYNRQGRKQ